MNNEPDHKGDGQTPPPPEPPPLPPPPPPRDDALSPTEPAPPAAAGGNWFERTWRRVSTDLLQLVLRALPREQNRLFALTVLVGGVCGLAAVLFHGAIRGAEAELIDVASNASDLWWIPGIILTPMLGALIAGLLLEYLVPAARGSGIPQVKVVYTIRSGRLRLRDAIGKFFVSTLQIGSGSSLGREGPTVQICAGIASSLGRVFALSPKNLRKLIPVGTAAGIAAAFNAPVAAVTFTIEELVGDLDQTVLSGVVVAAALAAVIERGTLGEHPVFEGSSDVALLHASSLIVYALMGVAAGFVSVAMTRSLLSIRARFGRLRRLPRWAHPGVGGLATGVIAAVVLATIDAHGITGGGYQTLSDALGGRLALDVMIVLCVAKLAATVLSYASGGAGGIFAPSLFIGGMLGGAFGFLDYHMLGHADADIGAFALVGMGAVFAGVIRAPITSVLIIFEMTRGYGLILPLMVANITSYVLARRWQKKPIYEALIEQDGIQLPHRSSAATALASLRVGQAMTRELATLPADIRVQTAVEQLKGSTYSTRPVLEKDGRFLGLVSEARLRRRAASGFGDELVRQQVTPREYLYPDQPLVDAVVRMNLLEVRQMGVVSRESPHELVGILTMSDVMRAHAIAAIDARAEEDEGDDERGGAEPPGAPLAGDLKAR